MKKCLSILMLLSFIIQLSSKEKVTRLYSFHESETYPDYELVEKTSIEKPIEKKEKYRIEHGDGKVRTLCDEGDNQILSLKQDIYKFDEYANFAVSENGIIAFNSYEKPFTPEYKTMIKWVDKKGNVINTYELKKNQAIRANYLADKDCWLIFTELTNYYEVIPDPTISYGGILVFDEYGNKALEIDIPSDYDNFVGYSTNKTGELIVASFYELDIDYSKPNYPYTIAFNINSGFSQELQQIGHIGVFSEDNKLFHSLRTLVDVTSGDVVFRSEDAYHAFPASRESGIIAIIDGPYFKILDYRNKKYLLWASDKRKATIHSVAPDASEMIIHDKGYAYKYKRKK